MGKTYGMQQKGKLLLKEKNYPLDWAYNILKPAAQVGLYVVFQAAFLDEERMSLALI